MIRAKEMGENSKANELLKEWIYLSMEQSSIPLEYLPQLSKDIMLRKITIDGFKEILARHDKGGVIRSKSEFLSEILE